MTPKDIWWLILLVTHHLHDSAEVFTVHIDEAARRWLECDVVIGRRLEDHVTTLRHNPGPAIDGRNRK